MSEYVHSLRNGDTEHSSWQWRAVILVALLLVFGNTKYLSQDGLAVKRDQTQAILEISANTSAFIIAGAMTLRARRSWRWETWEACLLGFLCLSAACSVFSWYPEFSWTRAYIMTATFLSGRMVVRLVGAKEASKAAYYSVTALLFCGVVVSLLWPNHYPLLVADPGEEDLRRRLSIFRLHHIALADICAVAFFASHNAKHPGRRLIQLALLIAVIATVARASMAIFVLLQSLLLIFGGNGRLRAHRLIVTALVVGLAAPLVVVFGDEILSESATLVRPIANLDRLVEDTRHNRTLTGRLSLWSVLGSDLSETNWIGFGFDGARMHIRSLTWSFHSHNSVLDAVFAAGYGGAALLLIGYCLAIHGALRSSSRSDTVNGMSILYILCVSMMGPTLVEAIPMALLALCGPSHLALQRHAWLADGLDTRGKVAATSDGMAANTA